MLKYVRPGAAGILSILVTVVCVAGVDGGAGQRGEAKSIEDAVLAVSAEMTKAGEAADADRLFSFVLENDKGCIIQNGALLTTRQEALEQVRSNLARGSASIQYRWKRQYVTVLSPDAAVLVAEGDVTATRPSGQVTSQPLAQTIVFVLRDGKWRALHAHQSTPAAR